MVTAAVAVSFRDKELTATVNTVVDPALARSKLRSTAHLQRSRHSWATWPRKASALWSERSGSRPFAD
jgi:hypothetical protein